MGSAWAIRVENLGKQYELGESAGRPSSLYESLSDALSWLAGRERSRSLREKFWALRDLNFDVEPGEVIGVIGRNGAGKSTLLKILSRITTPTEGRALLRGKLSSLLEVGTGFHPQLTGRENIFLNGTILGMRRREIERRFDEIVAFAEIEEFLDTPVKRYSSGMYVRLAFSVAAHLVADILLVDEVLAVGDTAFRAKCFDQLDTTARSGRTVVLVSHDLAAIEGLTSRCLLVDHGRVVSDGPTRDVLETYMASLEMASDGGGGRARGAAPDAQIREVRVGTGYGQWSGAVRTGGPADFAVEVECSSESSNVALHIGIYDHLVRHLALLDPEAAQGISYRLPAGRSLISCRVSRLALPPGRYSVSAAMLEAGVLLDAAPRIANFSVEGGDFYGTGRLPAAGMLLLDCLWATQPEAINRD